MSHTRYMVKQDHRVVRWYPRQMYERFRAVESIAYELRKYQKQKTRVKIGRSDIELSTREPGSSVWRKQVLPNNLPKFEITEFRTAMPSSPPPGRPGRSVVVVSEDGGAEAEVREFNDVAREEATANTI